MKRLIMLLLILGAVPYMVSAAEVKNLKVGQVGDNAVATYDLAGGAGEQDAEVTVAITIGNERRTSEKLSLTGDFGKGVKVGTGKKIVWNVLKDFPSGTGDNNLSWDVKVVGGKFYKDPTLGMEFVNIQGGCYQMGDTFGDGQAIEKPVHEVCVNDFALAKYDVTVGEFRKFVVATGYKTEAEEAVGCAVWNGSKLAADASKNWSNPGFNQDNSSPVVCVSWNDANAFIDWLSEVSGTRYRLPTEAEWEYAARSGGKAEKYAGGNDIDAVAWYKDNSGGMTHRVGTKQPNGLGLYDMSGNVWQWVQDWYVENYYRDSPRSNPRGPGSGQYRLLRGGSWRNIATYSRASSRDGSGPIGRNVSVGFRLARTP